MTMQHPNDSFGKNLSDSVEQVQENQVTSSFISPQCLGEIRRYIAESDSTTEIAWEDNPVLDELLMK